MQDPTQMTFAARAAAKDDQIASIARREATEVRLKKELADEQAARAEDEKYLVQLALADAGANQLILERYAQYLPPPAPPAPPPPPPEAQPESGAASTGSAEVSTDAGTDVAAPADPAAQASDAAAGEAVPVT
ncbi:MAG: hypothetical protein IPK75_01260 [Acidobacteria bacterium]|nr:hypothetical protein [Acidobacteriota bacterium]